jgi:L-ascorbate metabolism protein UlaG (beta-lactamase superfamily)
MIEPLVDSWYAWSYLIPPATLARNITERHLRIMESYIEAPEVHAMAVKNPKFLGGPFIDCDGNHVEEIKTLAESTRKERRLLIDLSNALVDLSALLMTQAKGHSLIPIYPQIPPCLQGYVELGYDLNNQADFRLLEELLYKSRFYDDSLQSLMLSATIGDERPFALSTPRLASRGKHLWRVPFNHPSVDAFFALKSRPQRHSSIRDILSLSEHDAPLVAEVTTREAPRRYEPYCGRTARWRYFGHACVLIETPTVSVLFDPVISYEHNTSLPRYTYLDLPDRIDYVLITHNHQDHLMLETLLQLRHKIGNVVVPRGSGTLQDPSVRLLLTRIGFKNVIEISDFDELPFQNGTISALPFIGEHCDLDVRSKTAYLVRAGRHSLLFAADSCNVEPKLYEHIHTYTGDIDVLFLGMECVGAPLSWVYGSLLPKRIDRTMDESRRLAGSNCSQAMRIVEQLRCREVYVYAMGQEPWLNHVMSLKYTETSKPIVESNQLLRQCHDRGISAERLFGEREMFLRD